MVAIFPASTKGGGLCLAFPDVCKTPAPVGQPIPYPNIAKTAQEAQKSKTKVQTKTAAVARSHFSRSQGDSVGVMKGIASSKTKAKTEISQIKALLNQHHSKLMAMNSNNPDEWQKLLGDYLVAAGALYVTKHNAE